VLTASSSGSSASFLVPNATFIVELAIFLVILGLVAKFIIPSLRRVLDERAGILSGGVTVTDAARADAVRLGRERSAILDDARQRARAVLEAATREVEGLIEDARARGQVEHDRLVVEAAARIDDEQRRVHELVMGQAVELVVTAAERIVGGGLEANRHRATIAAELAEADAAKRRVT
jgi:F-type H+-transporting ATPase subunit b